MFDNVPLVLAQAGEPASEDKMPVIPKDDHPTNAMETVPSYAPSTGNDLPPQSSGGPSIMQFLPFILILGLFWFIMMGGQRKEKKKRAKMLAAITKGDKVQTVGGILGSIVEVRDSDVIVKVDENANIRIKFARSAIQSVIEERETQ